MLFNFRRRERHIDQQEQAIQAEKRKLHAKIERDIRAVERVNKVLSNGITLKIHIATGGKH